MLFFVTLFLAVVLVSVVAMVLHRAAFEKRFPPISDADFLRTARRAPTRRWR